MSRFVRPNSKKVWNNPDANERMSRYRAIIDDRRWAKYLLTKDIEADVELDASTDKLWDVHKQLSEKFQEHLGNVDDEGKRIGEAEQPEQSFLNLKAELAQRILQDCHFCERKCGADRTRDEKGWCKLGHESRVSSAFLHTGEEAPLVPSGTIFFASCCFGCVFCQNYDISTNPNNGRVVNPEDVASIAERLHDDGALNINYVGGDPIPNTHTIIASMQHQESNVTQLWNSNLYCSEDTMKLLFDVIDVWLPDFKYGNNECGKRLSGVTRYFDVVSRNHAIAYDSGEVIVRHLVMPNHVDCCSIPVLEWIAENIPQCMVNIMGQYRPQHKVTRQQERFSDIARPVHRQEMQRVFDKADELGICWRPVS
ncbi:MAG: radical SAM protein [Candidatus Thorarchaeota archaeon]|nr:radical SAM protein [Candidatus Thorarchaeota archaeon]